MPDFQPNFLVIDPVTGEINAVFPGGIVMPQEVDPAGPTIPRAKRVSWERADGSLASTIGSRKATSSDFEQLFFREIEDEVSVEGANLNLTRYGPTHFAKPNRVEVSASAMNSLGDNAGVVIIDHLGNSDFAKQIIASAVTFDAGSVGISFPGSPNGTGTINHNLGGIPNGVVFGVQNSAAGNVVVARITMGATTITVNATTNTGAAIGPGTVNCFWLAWRNV